MKCDTCSRAIWSFLNEVGGINFMLQYLQIMAQIIVWNFWSWCYVHNIVKWKTFHFGGMSLKKKKKASFAHQNEGHQSSRLDQWPRGTDENRGKYAGCTEAFGPLCSWFLSLIKFQISFYSTFLNLPLFSFFFCCSVCVFVLTNLNQCSCIQFVLDGT